jgi:hypothetical protein
LHRSGEPKVVFEATGEWFQVSSPGKESAGRECSWKTRCPEPTIVTTKAV